VALRLRLTADLPLSGDGQWSCAPSFLGTGGIDQDASGTELGWLSLDARSRDSALRCARMSAPDSVILHTFEPRDGGVPQHVAQIVEGLREHGFGALVAGRPDSAIRSRIEKAGIRYEPVELVGDLVAPRHDGRALRRLIDLAREPSVAIVHTHGQKAGVLGRLAALRAHRPSAYTPNSLVYTTQLLRPRRSARARWLFGRQVERFLGRRCAAIVAVSEEERRTVLSDGLAPPERVRVVHNGVDPQLDAAPDPQLVEFKGEGPLFGMVAGLRDQKGLPTLLEALELLAARGELPRFAIVGNGPFYSEVQHRIASPALAGSVLLAPFEGRPEAYLQALDVFVLPSYWEGLPIAVLEAMAMARPVIASSVGGTPEAVEHGVTGLLVPMKDPVTLADRIAELAKDPDARSRMGAAGRKRSQTTFSTKSMVDSVAELYREILSSADDSGRGAPDVTTAIPS
jgi:glycosyltransferase involved in cell wall biosynthesis